jgi:hypothetical protein
MARPLDGSVGILVYGADSAQEAQQMNENDPAVKAEIGDPGLRPFRAGHLSGD